jgi:hypothetical protein
MYVEVWWGKPEGRPNHTWENNIKMGVKEV